MTDVSTGVWLGKNQKEIQNRTQNLDSDGNLTGNVTGTLDGNVNKVTGDLRLESDNDVAIYGNGVSSAIELYCAKSITLLSDEGTIIMEGLPTSDPVNAGQLWNDAGTLKVSAG